MQDDTRRTRPGAFFGRRKGHHLRPRHAALIETLLPHLKIDVAKSAPEHLRVLFSPPISDVRLEIGFGGGEHLIAEAQAHPQTGFIGIEPFVNGMAKTLALIDEARLANVRLYFDDALDIIEWLPMASIARIDLIYPDPWPKRRHWKRRFVQDRTIATFANILRPGGEFRFVSDWPDYVAWTLEKVAHSSTFLWTAERANDWRLPWEGFTSTRYEAKAKREGRFPNYLIFRRRG